MQYDTSRRFCLRLLAADSVIAPSCYFSRSLAARCASVRTRGCLEKVVLAQWVAWNKLTQLCSLWSTRKHNFASSLNPTAVIFIFQSFSTGKFPFLLVNKSTLSVTCHTQVKPAEQQPMLATASQAPSAPTVSSTDGLRQRGHPAPAAPTAAWPATGTGTSTSEWVPAASCLVNEIRIMKLSGWCRFWEERMY